MDMSLKFDDYFKSKLMILAFALLIFAVSLLLFQSSEFHFIELFDMSNIQLLIPKLYSVSFILFIISYSLVLALSSFYSFKTSVPQSLFGFLFVVIALVFSLLYSSGFSALISFSLVPFFICLLNSKSESLNLSSSYNSVSRGLYALLVLGFIFVFLMVSSNQAFYFNYFLNSTASIVPGASSSVAEMCANALSNLNYSNAIPQSAVVDYANISYTANRNAILQVNGSFVQILPSFDSLNSTQQNSVIGIYRQSILSNTGTIIQELQNAASNSSQTVSPQTIQSSLSSLPYFSALENNFALIMAFTVLALLAVFVIVLKFFSFVFLFVMVKA